MIEPATRRLLLALTAVMAALLCAPASAPGKALDPSKTAPRDFWSSEPERVGLEVVRIPGSQRFDLANTTPNASGRTKWLSRDPLGERGGLNLSGFVNNDPVNNVDYLGMSTILIGGGGSSSPPWPDPVEILPAVMEPAPEGLVQPLLDELNALISKEIGWRYVDRYDATGQNIRATRTAEENDRWFNARTDWSLVPPGAFEDIFNAAFARSSVPESYKAGIFEALVRANAEQQANAPTSLAERSHLAHVAGAAILTLGGTAEFAAALAIPGPTGEARITHRLLSGSRLGRAGRASRLRDPDILWQRNANIGGGSTIGARFEREIQEISLRGEIALPAGARDSPIRHLMADITAVTGNEVALLRLANPSNPGKLGARVLRMGGVDWVSTKGAARVIAHTHPSGSFIFSNADLFILNKLGQRSSVLIDPVSLMGVSVPIR